MLPRRRCTLQHFWRWLCNLLLARRWPRSVRQRSNFDQCVYQTLRMLVVCASRVHCRASPRGTAAWSSSRRARERRRMVPSHPSGRPTGRSGPSCGTRLVLASIISSRAPASSRCQRSSHKTVREATRSPEAASFPETGASTLRCRVEAAHPTAALGRCHSRRTPAAATPKTNTRATRAARQSPGR